jgi:hypothetical protein
LFLSQKTVRNYVSGILDKLQVADRAEARLVASRRNRQRRQAVSAEDSNVRLTNVERLAPLPARLI